MTLSKHENTDGWKRMQRIALSWKLALGEAMDNSQDGLRDDDHYDDNDAPPKLEVINIRTFTGYMYQGRKCNGSLHLYLEGARFEVWPKHRVNSWSCSKFSDFVLEIAGT